MASSKSTATDPTNRATWLVDLRIGLCCCLLSNAIVLAAVWYGANRMTRGDGEPTGSRTLPQAMLGFDGEHYLTIARRGYDYRPHQRSSVAFFPVYPLAALDVAMITGMSLNAALLVVSNLCFAAALVLLATYCRRRWPDAPERVQWYVVMACALLPAGCFFHMAYTESCFLLLSVAALLGFQRRWPPGVAAGIIGLATAARPTGVALLAPFATYLWRGRSSLRSGLFAPALWLPIACWGLLSYMAYQEAMFGDVFAFAETQSSWRIQPLVSPHTKALALATLEPVRAVYDASSPACWRRFDRHWLLSWQFANPIFFTTAWVLLALGIRRRWLASGEAWFIALLLLIPYVTRGYEMGMGSMGRFVSVAFPICFVLGQMLARCPKWLSGIALAVMAAYLAIFSARFAAGYFVF